MPTPRSGAIHDKVEELNDHILPPGVKIVPFLDRSDLVHYTTHTVLHNLTEGIILVVAHPVPVSGQRPRRPDCRADHSVLPAVRLHLPRPAPYSGNLLSLGALDFGMVVDGAVVMVENIVRHLGRQRARPRIDAATRIREAAHEVQRPVFYAIGIIITAYLPIFTLQSVEGRLFKPMAWTVAFALLGALIFPCWWRPVLASFLFRSQTREWRNPVLAGSSCAGIGSSLTWMRASPLADGRRRRPLRCAASLYLASSGVIGSEFLPHLDEGAIWARGTLAPSTGPTEGTAC